MKKILIVDDTPSNIDILVGYLEDEYELLIALDGYGALEILEHDTPDLILLDIRMPGMDGFSTCKEIKNRPLSKKVPIVFLTAENDEGSIKNAFESGGVDYVKKPIILEELKARIKTHLNLSSYTHDLESIIQEKTEEIKNYLHKDSITSLKNSFSLKEEIETFAGGTLFILDINNFNTYNKLNGFLYGNKILEFTANELGNYIASKHDYKLYKLSVDRFAILCRTYELKSVEKFCEDIFVHFDNFLLQIDTIYNFVNFCIGATQIDSYEKSIIEAEYALDYTKKQSGRTYMIYQEDSHIIQEEYESIATLKKNRELILENRIIPFFQPIVNAYTKEIDKYEALVRIQDGNLILTPDKFLDSAQRLGMMGNITKEMIIKTFQFFSKTNLKFSINLTQRDILDNTLVSFIQNNAIKYNIKLSNITFEILENLTLSANEEKIKNVIALLKQGGSKIAIDDFGSENSNFSRLLSLQADYIKIDGLFIKECDVDIEKQKIIKAIVELARALGIKCIAEFVSTEKIFETVALLGVDYVQGYYFGKPKEELIFL